MLLPAATTVAPQIDLMACRCPSSIVTDTKVIYPTVILKGTKHTARANVDGRRGPHGKVRFSIGRTYVVRGNCSATANIGTPATRAR